MYKHFLLYISLLIYAVACIFFKYIFIRIKKKEKEEVLNVCEEEQ